MAAEDTTVEPNYGFISLNELQLISKIGNGATASVFSARTREGVTVALKCLDPSRIAELDAEELALSKLHNAPHIISCLGSTRSCAHPQLGSSLWSFLLLQYCPHGDLLSFLETTTETNEIAAKHMIRQLFTAVSSFHAAGVSHRDIKPENILLADDWSLRLSDFGSAVTDCASFRRDCCGTTVYQAPEVFGRHEYNPLAVDVWSAIVTSFVILMGHFPFQEPSSKCAYFKLALHGHWPAFWRGHERIGRKLSAAAMRFIERGLCVDPEMRPAADEILNDPWLSGLGVNY
jgi:serine/threonine protein kinase